MKLSSIESQLANLLISINKSHWLSGKLIVFQARREGEFQAENKNNGGGGGWGREKVAEE